MNPAETMHRGVDALIANLRATQPENFNPPCHSGCFWCCYEPLMTSGQEADYLLDGMTDDQREALKPLVRAWLEKAAPQLAMPYDDNLGLGWRRAMIPCPLLVDGKCSVYDRRPVGCRVFFARSHAENCEMPMREHQKFAVFPHPSPIDVYIAEFAIACRRSHLDHLGIHLANKLLGMNVHSGAGQQFEVSEK